jgi:hypothetical protein
MPLSGFARGEEAQKRDRTGRRPRGDASASSAKSASDDPKKKVRRRDEPRPRPASSRLLTIVVVVVVMMMIIVEAAPSVVSVGVGSPARPFRAKRRKYYPRHIFRHYIDKQ